MAADDFLLGDGEESGWVVRHGHLVLSQEHLVAGGMPGFFDARDIHFGEFVDVAEYSSELSLVHRHLFIGEMETCETGDVPDLVLRWYHRSVYSG